jgi:hypothetical protein
MLMRINQLGADSKSIIIVRIVPVRNLLLSSLESKRNFFAIVAKELV